MSFITPLTGLWQQLETNPNTASPQKKSLGAYVRQDAGLVDFEYYVETYSKPNDKNSEITHIYKGLSQVNGCDRDEGMVISYLDIWECNEFPNWLKATQNDNREFCYVGPPLINVAERVVKEKLKWTTLKTEDIFSPEGAKKKFYYELIKTDSVVLDDSIRIKIIDVVHRHLVKIDYGVYYMMGQIRLSFQNQLPKKEDIAKLNLDKKLLEKIWSPLMLAGNELFTLYNRDRVKYGLKKILANQASQAVTAQISAQIKKEKQSAEMEQKQSILAPVNLKPAIEEQIQAIKLKETQRALDLANQRIKQIGEEETQRNQKYQQQIQDLQNQLAHTKLKETGQDILQKNLEKQIQELSLRTSPHESSNLASITQSQNIQRQTKSSEAKDYPLHPYLNIESTASTSQKKERSGGRSDYQRSSYQSPLSLSSSPITTEPSKSSVVNPYTVPNIKNTLTKPIMTPPNTLQQKSSSSTRTTKQVLS